MSRSHAREHGRHKGFAPALWVAATVTTLFVSSLVAIAWLLHKLAAFLLELASRALEL